MLHSMNAWAAPNAQGYEEVFHDFAEAGFDGVELTYEMDSSNAHALTPSTTDEELRRIRALADARGLRVTSICCALLGNTIGSPDRAENEKGMGYIRRGLEMGKILGCRSILVYPGGFTEHNSLANSYKRALELMREMRPEIEEQDMLVAVENANQFFLSPFDYARFLDDIGSDKIGAYLDFANVQIFQYPYSDHWLDVLGARVCNVHIKDYKPLGLGLGVFVPLLSGAVPYKRIMPMLKKTGYTGPLVAEFPNMMPEEPKHLYKTTKQALEILDSYESIPQPYSPAEEGAKP